jgi:P4 family phage/plasmid primase-like protien
LNTSIFQTYAPAYWAAGLPAIPLRQRNKMPDINQWSAYGLRMPSELEQHHWMASFPRGNIGLPLGPQSGVAIIDIDTEDEALIEAILDCLPKSPWKRVGKKGMALAYRFEGQKNFKLRGADGGMLLEFLGLGNQCVMPPSIHPDTQLPYTANCNLWEVLNDLPELGEDIEDKLRGLLGSKGFELGAGGRSGPLDVIPAGERDVQMVRHAGYLARVVLGIDKSATFSLNDAIAQMHHWVSNFTAKVAGDAMDPEKGTAKLLEFLLKDLEKGRTMPAGWDANMPEEWKADPRIAKLFEMNQAQRWDGARARQWLSGKIAEKPNDDDWAIQCVFEIIDEVAKDEHFLERDTRVLIQFMMNLCPRLFKKSDLLIAWKDSKKGLSAGNDNEADNHVKIARELLEALAREGDVRFHQGQFWQWNGSCFTPVTHEEIYQYVGNNVATSVLARTHAHYMQITQVMQRMAHGPLAQSGERGINFANGFVTEDLRILDHDPKYGCTFTLPFNYDREQAKGCGRWLEFLASCWEEEPDFAERVMALQEMFAVTLFKLAPRYQKAFLLFGKASTGKTVTLKVLRSMLPITAVAELGPDHWSQRFALTDLVGKAANICGELPENGRISGSIFKQVVEGSPVRSEFKGKDGFGFMPECAHWFASNYLPQSSDTTLGFIRRWQVLDFNKPVAAGDRIEDLAEQIVAQEREAIAAWALEGLRRVLDRRGFTEPACHQQRLGQMRRINNSVAAFLEDTHRYERGEGLAPARDVYDDYVFHVRDVGRNRPVTFERFIQILEDLNLKTSKIRGLDHVDTHMISGLVKVARKAA